jgi:hypothetical protein
MALYKTVTAGVRRTTDGATIPNDATNTDWQDFLKWQLAGNTPDPADPPAPPTAVQVQTDAARIFDKLILLRDMTYAQIITHVDNAFSTFTAVQRDDLKVLALLASIHAKNL